MEDRVRAIHYVSLGLQGSIKVADVFSANMDVCEGAVAIQLHVIITYKGGKYLGGYLFI